MYSKKISLKQLLVLASICFASQFIAQQQNSAYSLQQAIEYALKNSPGHLNTGLDEQNSEYKKGEIRASGLPQINGSVDFKDYLEIPTSLIPASAFNPFAPAGTYAAVKFGVKYNATAGLSASQLLFSADYLYGMKAASQYINLSRINTQRSKADVVAGVSKAYYSVLISKERLKQLDANIAKIEKSLSDLRATNKQGFVEMIDVERLEVAYNNLVIEKEKVTQLIGVGENLLKFQMGYKITDPILLGDSLSINQDLKEEISLAAIDVTKRPDYQILKTQQSLYTMDVQRQQWGYLPTLAAYGSYQFNSQRPTTNFFETDKSNAAKQWYPIALVGITMNVNIFDGLLRHNKIQQAKVTRGKNENTIKTLELAAQMESSTAAITFNNALKSMGTSKRNIELAQHVLDVSQKKYDQGVGSNLEVITAQASLRESEVNYFSSLYDAIIAKIDFQKATGTLVK
jgi:outer membrane protein